MIVQKYGGSSVATTEAIKKVAALIARRWFQGARLCVVVSAMGKTTDQLLKQAHEISNNPSRRELDMLLSCGERASMALLAMALDTLGVPSVSLTGSQSGIITDDVHSGAKIIEVRPHRVQEALAQNKVVIVAGFQGVSFKREVTTLGRGGSDTTAIALAAALQADACEIYSDVDGVYSADPRVVPSAVKLETLSIEEMEQLALCGAKVLNAEAVSFAKRHGIQICTNKTGNEAPGTLIASLAISQWRRFAAVAHRETICVVHLEAGADLSAVLMAIEGRGIKPVQILHSAQEGFLLIPIEDAHGLEAALTASPGVKVSRNWGSVSLVGQGLARGLELVTEALTSLNFERISVHAVFSNPLSATFLVNSNQVQDAARSLHRLMETPLTAQVGKIFPKNDTCATHLGLAREV